MSPQPRSLPDNCSSRQVEWLSLEELTDEYAIFKKWPTELDRLAVTHLMDMPDLEWEKVEGDRFYMTRAQYYTCAGERGKPVPLARPICHSKAELQPPRLRHTSLNAHLIRMVLSEYPSGRSVGEDVPRVTS